MYETEVNSRAESPSQIPAEILSKFGELSSELIARTVLPWSEHCTECVWPTCYSTCDLYEPREDRKCRRFVDGMVRIAHPDNSDLSILKIRFKRWGKLWAPANVHLFTPQQANEIEHRDRRIGKTLFDLPLPSGVKRLVTWRRYDFKKKSTISRAPSTEWPDNFILESFNPQDEAVKLTLTIRALAEGVHTPFEKLVDLSPGYNRARVPIQEITRILDLHTPFSVELIPNESWDGLTLYFGIMEFVKEGASKSKSGTIPLRDKSPTFKCVVWDLDNTLWEGILIEDGPEKLRLKPGVREVIEELDRRGILISIASKNNPEEAIRALKQFGIDEYFLHPQFSWGPKSEAIKSIARRISISLESIAFIDDSDFELEEVRSGCPEVRLLTATEYLVLPEMQECKLPITFESQNRRKLYQTEGARQSAAEGFKGDYLGFLRSSRMQMKIEPLSPSNIERVHELTQRTNQMNFSGNRYERGVLDRILASKDLDTFVLTCQDRFGSYGIVGFSIVDLREPRMTDLMFSCRVQSKRVEHAFLTFILRKYRVEVIRDFWVNYRKTPRNAPAGRVFDDFGMEVVVKTEGVTSLVFRKDREIPDDEIVELQIQELADKGEVK